jgi:hypothetical protein
LRALAACRSAVGAGSFAWAEGMPGIVYQRALVVLAKDPLMAAGRKTRAERAGKRGRT